MPTAGHWAVTSEEEALAVLAQVGRPLVVKADGLAAGKGVTVADTLAEAEAAIREAFGGRFGSAGSHLVLEERLQGPRCRCSPSVMGSGWCCCHRPRTTSG